MGFDQAGSEGSAGRVPLVDGSFSSNSAVSPMGELMRAMVLRVVDDVRAGGELREDALAYMDATPEEGGDDYVLSFKNVASYLGICPKRLRNAIVDPGRSISTRRRAA